MRMLVRRLLRKYKYPPDEAKGALETVMRQCELWVDETEYESKAGAALPQRVCCRSDTPLAALPSRPPFQHFGVTSRLSAPFATTAARFAIEERTKLPFPSIHKRAKQ